MYRENHGIIASGKLEASKEFSVSEAKQRKTNKSWTGSSFVSRKQVYVDISFFK